MKTTEAIIAATGRPHFATKRLISGEVGYFCKRTFSYVIHFPQDLPCENFWNNLDN